MFEKGHSSTRYIRKKTVQDHKANRGNLQIALLLRSLSLTIYCFYNSFVSHISNAIDRINSSVTLQSFTEITAKSYGSIMVVLPHLHTLIYHSKFRDTGAKAILLSHMPGQFLMVSHPLWNSLLGHIHQAHTVLKFRGLFKTCFSNHLGKCWCYR